MLITQLVLTIFFHKTFTNLLNTRKLNIDEKLKSGLNIIMGIARAHACARHDIVEREMEFETLHRTR